MMEESELYSEDEEETYNGMFGWIKLDYCLVLYVIRVENEIEVKYVSKITSLNNVLAKYFLKLHPKICECADIIESYSMTETEKRNFRRLNSNYLVRNSQQTHPECPSIIKFEELKKYYTYITSCFYKLTSQDNLLTETFGLLRINIDSVLPYYVQDNVKYVPFVYFENKLKELEPLTIVMEKWAYVYIKFCYLVHGVKYDFSNIKSFSMISIDLVKNHLRPNIEINEYWPNDTNDLVSLEYFNNKFPLSSYPLQETESLPESNLDQHVPAINIADAECISKMQFGIWAENSSSINYIDRVPPTTLMENSTSSSINSHVPNPVSSDLDYDSGSINIRYPDQQEPTEINQASSITSSSTTQPDSSDEIMNGYEQIPTPSLTNTSVLVSSSHTEQEEIRVQHQLSTNQTNQLSNLNQIQPESYNDNQNTRQELYTPLTTCTSTPVYSSSQMQPYSNNDVQNVDLHQHTPSILNTSVSVNSSHPEQREINRKRPLSTDLASDSSDSSQIQLHSSNDDHNECQQLRTTKTSVFIDSSIHNSINSHTDHGDINTIESTSTNQVNCIPGSSQMQPYSNNDVQNVLQQLRRPLRENTTPAVTIDASKPNNFEADREKLKKLREVVKSKLLPACRSNTPVVNMQQPKVLKIATNSSGYQVPSHYSLKIAEQSTNRVITRSEYRRRYLRTSNITKPYTVKTINFWKKNLPCVNSKPNIHSDMMVSIIDLVQITCPLASVIKCVDVLQKYLRLSLYKANENQLKVLSRRHPFNIYFYSRDTLMIKLNDLYPVYGQFKNMVDMSLTL